MGNGAGFRGRGWLKHLAVAVGYALVYEAQHPFSQPQFFLGSAVRLICLLLLPYRYWPALAAGELVTNWLVVYPCLDQLGPAWVAVRAIPPIMVIMPIVWWCRERMALFPTKHLVDIKALLICIFASSLAWTAYSLVAKSVAIIQAGDVSLRPIMALGYFTGNYFAILALVPWALIARFEYRTGQWRERLYAAMGSRMFFEGMVIMLPATALLVLYGYDRAGYQQPLLMAMFLPVALLTLRHGWRGAALGGTITIICAAIIVPSQMMDASAPVIQSELFLAATVTALFALGARITSHLMHDRRQLNDTLNTQHVARQSYQRGEYRQRQTALALERLAHELHLANIRWLQLHRLTPNIESEVYYQRAIAVHQELSRLAESMHPSAWRERGLPAALLETVGRTLDEAGIAYRCDITGRGFMSLPPMVLAAAYRATCEAVAHVSSRTRCSSIHVTLRGGETNQSRWIFIGVDGSLNDEKVVHAIHLASARRHIAAKLGAHGLTVSEQREHVQLFDGQLHHREDHARSRITMLLHDKREWRHKRTTTPLRLWVQ